MSHTSAASLGKSSFHSVPRTAARGPTPTPVLIAEHEVALSTAAAVSAATAHRRRPATTWLAHLGQILTALTRPQPHRPRREPDYFQAARMSRAMDRL